MIFLTVGTQFPFDRLVKAVDEAVGQNFLEETVYAQIGDSSYRPRHFEATQFLEKRFFDQQVKQATGIVSHAGMGSITTALENDKPLLVMPRLKKYGEVVNNHQAAIAEEFEKLGHLLVAHNVDELSAKIKELKSFVPRKRQTQVREVVERISRFLSELSDSKNRSTQKIKPSRFSRDFTLF